MLPPGNEPPVDQRPVDVFLNALTDPRPDHRAKNKDYRPREANDTAYSRKVKPDAAAIANYEALPRPLKPPVKPKARVYEWDEVEVRFADIKCEGASLVEFYDPRGALGYVSKAAESA